MTRSSAADVPDPGIRSVLNALRVLETLSTNGDLGVSELSRLTKIPKTSAFRLLRTLDSAGWIRSSAGDDGRWCLTSKALTVGVKAPMEIGFREACIEEMKAIRDAFGETVHFSVRDDCELVIVARVDGINSLRTFLEIGTRAPLQSSAGGRAMLSVLPDTEVDRILSLPLKQYTDETILDHAEVTSQVERARDQGFATNGGEWREGIGAIGVPVVSQAGELIGALSISMPMKQYLEIDHRSAASVAQLAADHLRKFTSGFGGPIGMYTRSGE